MISFSFFSCSKDDDAQATQIPEIHSYRTIYMDYPQSVMPWNNPLSLVKLEYDHQGKLSKRWGGLMPINNSTGYDHILAEGIYDEIVYKGNQVLITKNDTLKNMTVYPEKKTIIIVGNKMVNYIREIIIKTPNSFTPAQDTTWLYYTHNTLFRTVTKDRTQIFIKDFNFDGNGNLTKIKGLAINRHLNDTMYLQTETFSDYDNANNPIKNLGMFDELFYRSLSRNNYRKYTKQQFSPDSTQFSNETKNWILKYDSEGKVKFDE